ncbi:protein of unknown function [Pseudorhizobium banfieldiae]|uniref:Uncharacterized protein n=1 Tax=Pseudorhizobium banfieldiae TaxID=1125847 RepID=L0NL88_9HYPH|nr:protein of unknown function [Pseudorhizobium banfieldiae]
MQRQHVARNNTAEINHTNTVKRAFATRVEIYWLELLTH